MTDEPERRKGKKAAFTLRTKSYKDGIRALATGISDRRTRVYQLAQEMRVRFARDLGGEENLSEQQHAVLGMAVENLLVVEALGNWIWQQKTLITKRRHVQPVVMERAKLCSAALGMLQALGLERRLPPPQKYVFPKAEPRRDPDAGAQ